jgi:hypothetical protein
MAAAAAAQVEDGLCDDRFQVVANDNQSKTTPENGSPGVRGIPRFPPRFPSARAPTRRRDGVTLTVSAAAGTPESIAAGVRRLAPELLRCPMAYDAEATPPESRSVSRFVVDRTGRPAVVSAQRGTASGGVNGVCLDNVLEDANLGLPGDGRTLFEVDLVFARR